MKIETRLLGTTVLLLLGTIGAWTAQAAEGQNYIMVVYSDRAHGEAVLEDHYARVISKLDRNGGEVDNFTEQVSLCVALTKTRQFERATEYCDMAIAESEREARRFRNYMGRSPYSRAAVSPRAVALTNRGVLHALTGQPEEARSLFEMAQEADLMEEYAQNNLARLQLSMKEGGS